MTDKLEYFNLGARGQPIRLAYLLSSKLSYEDKRYEFSEWPTRKSSTPLGQLPVLTVDGVEYTQSAALLRYVGGKAGAYPAPGSKDQLIVEDVMETMNEIWSNVPKTEQERKNDYLGGKVAKAVSHIEKISSSSGPFVLGADISVVADLFPFTAMCTFSVAAFGITLRPRTWPDSRFSTRSAQPSRIIPS